MNLHDSFTSPRETGAITPDDQAELDLLEAKVNALLPQRYQSCFDSVSPTSMGSAALKYGPDSRVAWDEIWTHFCDLALAGGPPHRGSLLEAPTPEEVIAEPAGYQLVYEEILRGIRMTSGLAGTVDPEPGWVTVRCHGEEMASWLLRAVMAENVFVRQRQDTIQVPAGPRYRISKEVKNVVVALAKTCHYWSEHLTGTEQSAAARAMSSQTVPLLEPPCRSEVLARPDEYASVAEHLGQAIQLATGLTVLRSPVPGWIGVPFPDEKTAAWYVRSAIAENMLARREADTLYLPVPLQGPEDVRFDVAVRLARLHRLWGLAHRNRPGS